MTVAVFRIYINNNYLQLIAFSFCFYRFSGQTMSSKSLVLLTVKVSPTNTLEADVTLNCEKLVIGSMLLSEIKTALTA